MIIILQTKLFFDKDFQIDDLQMLLSSHVYSVPEGARLL
jgi:hypothetical protein